MMTILHFYPGPPRPQALLSMTRIGWTDLLRGGEISLFYSNLSSLICVLLKDIPKNDTTRLYWLYIAVVATH